MTTTTTRPLKFGIEIEVASSKTRSEFVEAFERAGIPVKTARYGSDVDFEQWKIQTDGSLGSGWEVVSPPQYDTETLQKVLRVLRNTLKVRCTKLTGLHVHHDISDLPISAIKNLYRLYYKYGSAFNAIMTESRRSSSYCRPIWEEEIKEIEKCQTTEEFNEAMKTRYKVLNFQAYIKYGTIEFRQHHGTTHPNEILPWIELTHKMIERAMGPEVEPTKIDNPKQALDELLVEVGLQHNKKLATHYNWAYKTRNKAS